MGKVKLVELNQVKPIEAIEIKDGDILKARIFYNFFSQPRMTQAQVSKEKYEQDNDEKIFYFSAKDADVALTIEEVERLILGLQNMVDNVKK